MKGGFSMPKGKVQRGRWSTKVNVLKQDRIIYDDEGYAVGYHDGRYDLGKYTVEGFSEKFYEDYELGYKEGQEMRKFIEEDEKRLKLLNKQTSQSNNSGCLVFLLACVSGIIYIIF